MKLSGLVLAVLLNLAAALPAAEQDATYADLIVAAPLPPDYKLTSQDIKLEGKKRGTMILVTKEGAIAKVIITIEDRELPTRDHRQAAFKAYVNASAQAIVQQGFRLTEHEPANFTDLDKLDYVKPVTVKLTYTDQTRKPLYQYVRGFFTTIGHSVVVIARDEADLKLLSQWADTVREK
jgi:hypothetical protein